MDLITAQRLGLPPPPEEESPNSTTSEQNGEDAPGSIKLDDLGPMVVNSDGTLSRTANWKQMTESERERTVRVLNARNKMRLANEAKKDNEGAQGEQMTLNEGAPASQAPITRG